MNYHKLNLEELLKTHDEYILLADFIEQQLKELESYFSPLMETGWKGKTADEFANVFEQMKTIHTEVAGGIRNYCRYMKIVQNNGTVALQETDRAVMQTFDGAASNDPGVNLGASFDCPAGEIDGALQALESAYESLGEAMRSKERLKNAVAYNSVGLAPYQKQVDEYITDVESFKERLQEKHAYINDFSAHIETQLGQGLTDITSFPFNDYQIDASRLRAPTSDISSPVYRAQEFVRVLSELPPGDRRNIEEMCYNAPEPFRTVFFAYIDQVHITQGTVNGSSISLPGLGITLDTSQTHTKNIAAPNGTNSVPAWYLTFFHEIGHAIDYATKATGDPAFAAAINEDVRNNLIEKAKNLQPTPSDADIQKAVDAIMKGKSAGPPNSSDAAWKDIQYQIQKGITDDMSGQGGTYGWYQVGNVSDVYGGATKNVLVGRNGNGEPNGHEDSYWTVLAPVTQASHLGSNDPSYGNSVVPRISPELEFFANSFSTGMAGYDASRAAAEDYLSGATDVMDEKMLELLEMARERIL